MGILVGDIGATNMRTAWYEDEGIDISSRVEGKLPYHCSSEEVYRAFLTLLEDSRNRGKGDLKGVSILVPGTVTHDGSILSCGNAKHLDGLPLKSLLEQDYGVSCVVHNDGAGFAVAEHVASPNRSSSAGYLNIGTGLAFKAMCNHLPWLGTDQSAGEFGRTPHPNGLGSMDEECGGQSFERKYGIKGSVLMERAGNGDEEALAIWKEYGVRLAQYLEYPARGYGLETITIGGVGKVAFDLYYPSLWDYLERVREQPGKDFRLRLVEPARLEYPNLVGAGMLHRMYARAMARPSPSQKH